MNQQTQRARDAFQASSRRGQHVADPLERSTTVAISPIPRYLKQADLYKFAQKVATPLSVRMFSNLKERNPHFNHCLVECKNNMDATRISAYLKTQRLVKAIPLSMDVLDKTA